MEKELLLFYIEGVDDSILKLNPFISKKGFEFIKYSLDEFEEKFIHFFTDEKERMSADESNTLFINSLVNSKYFNFNEIYHKNECVIFLRVHLAKSLNEECLAEINEDLDELIRELKLLKKGHVKLISSFDILQRDRWHFPDLPTSYELPSKKINYLKYSLQDADSSMLKFFSTQLLIPEYLRLAFNSFFESYNIEDEKLKFVMLMICLESVFNKSNQDPITHIISRHVALLITKDKDSFLKMYNEVRRLYNIRSAIVHGKDEKSSKENLREINTDVLKLEEIVRSVLKQLIWIHDFDLNMPKDKKELWNYLNARGFRG